MIGGNGRRDHALAAGEPGLDINELRLRRLMAQGRRRRIARHHHVGIELDRFLDVAGEQRPAAFGKRVEHRAQQHVMERLAHEQRDAPAPLAAPGARRAAVVDHERSLGRLQVHVPGRDMDAFPVTIHRLGATPLSLEGETELVKEIRSVRALLDATAQRLHRLEQGAGAPQRDAQDVGRIGVLGRQLDRLAKGGDGLVGATFQHQCLAQVDVRQGAARCGGDGQPETVDGGVDALRCGQHLADGYVQIDVIGL